MNTKLLNSRSVFAAIATLMLTVAAAHAQSAFTNALMNLSPGPVAYWPLQETTPPPAADVETNLGGLGPDANAYYITTNVESLSLTTLLPFSADSGAGMDFLGNGSSFMIVPTTDNRVSLPAGKPFSVELWVQPTTYNSYVCPVDQSGPFYGSALNPGLNGATNGNAGWMLGQMFMPRVGQPGYANHLYGWSFHVFNGVGSSGAEADAVYPFSTNTWYHIVGVFDGVNCSVYVDGANATTMQFPMTGSFVPDTWDPIQFGCNRGYGGNPYHGAVAEVAIYTNALSALQITNDYQAGLQGSGYTNVILANNPYMYWRLAAPAYTVPPTNTYPAANNYGSDSDPNIAGLYQPGTLPGAPGPQFSGMGVATNACAFNGMNSGVMIWTNNNQINNPLNATNKSISVALWFKGNPADLNVRTFQGIVSRGNSGWHLSLGPNGYLHWSAGVGSDLVSTWPYNDGNWHFIVAEYLNTGAPGPGGFGWAATNLLYVDGYLDSSALITNNETGSITNLALLVGGDPSFEVANLGIYANYISSQRYLAGSVAHVAYFNNALTAAQVQTLYNSATPNQAPYIVGQPASGRAVAGGPGTFVNFDVFASGTGPLSYQWYFNTTSNYSGAQALVNDNVNFFNEQTSDMTVSNLVNSESGYYYVVANNAYGYATSALASLTVYASPIITGQTPSGAFSMFTNQTTELSVSVLAPTNTLTYQWYTNGVADTTAGTSSNYFASAQAAANNETYQCIVANTYGSATSAVDTVTLQSLPSSLTASTYVDNLLGLNPTAYWPMHETEQPLLGDVETNYGSLGALGNGYYQDWAGPSVVVHQTAGALAGNADPATTFFGVNDTALVVPHRSPLLTIQYPYTLEAWIRPLTDNSQVGSYAVIIGQGGNSDLNNGPGRAGFALQYSGTANTFSLVIWTNASTTGAYEQKTVANYPPGVWYHLVATYDGTNVTYYIDGQEAGYFPGNATSGFPSQMLPDYWSPLTIGAGRWGTTGTSQGFDGEIDEVAVYTNLLTQQQIQDDYLAGTTPGSNYYQTVLGNGPLLYYHMDSPAYTPPPVSSWPALTNYGSVAVNGVYDPSAMPGADAGPGASGAFAANMDGTNAMAGNGVSSFADAGIAPQLNPVYTNSFSYTAWFRGYPTDDRNYNHIMAANDSTWRVCLNNGQVRAHGNSDISSPMTYNDGQWHQFVLTAQAGVTNGVWTGNFTNDLYVDGVLAISTIVTGTNNPAGSPGPEVLLGDEWGKTNSETEGNGGRSFAGDMCEAAFFDNTVLTPAQIQALYDSAGIRPAIVVQPISASGIITLGFTNSVTANGTGPLYFQWYTNGVAIGSTATNISGMITNGVTSDQLIITPVEFQDVGNYYVVVTNVYGAVTSSVVTLSGISTPVITSQAPTTYTNLFTLYAGVSPLFSVQAIGSPPLGYYWYTNGVADDAVSPGTNNSPSFTFSNVQAGFSTYCVVSNSFGTVQSIVWAAQVLPDPTNAYQQTVLAANPADYWRLDDTNLDGFDNGSGDDGYVVNDYAGGNNGTYTNVDLANGLGISSYNPAADPNDVGADFDYVSPSSDANSILAPDFAIPSGNAEFTVSVWVYPTAAEAGNCGIVNKGLFNQEEFNIDCGGPTNSFRFECRNAAGTDASASSTVTTAFPSAQNQWYHLVGVCDEANGNVYLYVNGQLRGTHNITAGSGLYNSSKTPISFGSRSSLDPTYFFGDDNQQFAGYIDDVAIFRYAMTPAQVANLYSGAGNIAPFFAQTPAVTNAVSAGANMTNSPATASGTAPLTYWWNLVSGGNTISNVVTGSTNGSILNANLIVSNTPATWNGDQLELVVSNAFGGTNFFVNLVVSSVPTIITNLPPQITILSDRYYTYAPSVIGTQPLHYQWYENNAPLAGQTNSTYSFLTGSQSTNTYYFIVTNANGLATSVTSTVTVVTSYQSMVLGNGPVAYWPLDETPDNSAGDDGVIAHDISGYGDNMFYTNSVIGLPGIPGDPYTVAQFGTFAGTPSMAEEMSASGLPDMAQEAGANGGNGEFTVEAWAAPASGQALNDRIVDEGHFFAEEWALDLGTTSPGEAFRFTIRNASGAEFDARGTVVPDGNWHYIVGVCDEANQNVLLYVDGVLNASNNFGGTITAGSGIEEDAQPITIGAADVSSTGVDTWGAQLIGKVSDVAIYTNILSASQILSHYQVVSAGLYPVPVVTNQLPLPNASPFTLYKGVSPSFMAVASGISPLSYQWYSNNVAVAGATNTTFSINNVQTNFSTYCIITNPAGAGTSMVWTASVAADPTSLFPATVLSNNPVAYWRLNETGGNIANDYAGGANGVYGSATTAGLPGVPFGGLPNETAVGMNNQASSVNAGSVANSGVILNTNTVTLLSWIYPTTGSENNPSGIIFCRSGSTVAGSQIGGGNALDYTWNGLPATYNYGSGLTVPANQWSLVALTTTPTNAILYVFNTNSVGSATNNVANAVQSFFGGLNIGADPQATNRIFQGEIGESAIFNHTLSSSQLSQLFAAATNGVQSVGFTTPPPISFVSTNGMLSLTWPSKYVGYYYLQVQTNKVTVGLSTNWVPYGGSVSSTLNSGGITNNINPANGTVFYRLMTNAP
jgi:hypothetical protein